MSLKSEQSEALKRLNRYVRLQEQSIEKYKTQILTCVEIIDKQKLLITKLEKPSILRRIIKQLKSWKN